MGNNWFSNFVPFEAPMDYDGIMFKTPEHFYQAMKVLDRNERIRIAAAETPGRISLSLNVS